jgi:hypothetical protein
MPSLIGLAKTQSSVSEKSECSLQDFSRIAMTWLTDLRVREFLIKFKYDRRERCACCAFSTLTGATA